MPPLGNLLTLKSLTFRTCFSVFHCLPALSISRVGEAITKTIPRDGRKLIKLMPRKRTFLPPRSQLIGQFVKRHLVTIRREQHVLAQWLRQYFCQDHGVRSVDKPQCYTVSETRGLSHFCFLTVGLSSTPLSLHDPDYAACNPGPDQAEPMTSHYHLVAASTQQMQCSVFNVILHRLLSTFSRSHSPFLYYRHCGLAELYSS